METINEIVARICELREVCDYTQEKLAKELGLTKEQYASYEENGDFPISVIYEIANKFGVDFNELVTGEPSRIDCKAFRSGVQSCAEGHSRSCI